MNGTGDEDLLIEIGLTEGQYRQALARMEKQTVRSAKKSETTFKRSNRSIERGFKASNDAGNAFARGGLRNVSLQLSQVAQQGAVTGDYMRALSFQLPDLAMGFGTVGIAAGALGGILAPLVVDFIRAGGAAREVSDVVSELSTAVDRYKTAVERAQTPTADLKEEYAGLADEVERYYQAQLQLERLDLMALVREAQTGLADTFGSIADVPEEYAQAYARALQRIEQLNRVPTDARGVSVLSDQDLAARNREIAVLQEIVDKVRPAIARIRQELDLTDEKAGDLLAALVRLREADTDAARLSALQDVQTLYQGAVEASGELTENSEKNIRAVSEAVGALIEMLNIQQDVGAAAGETARKMADTESAADRVASVIASIDLSNANAQADLFLGLLQASADEAGRIARNLDAARRSEFERKLDRENPDFFDPRGEGGSGQLPPAVLPTLPDRSAPDVSSRGSSGSSSGGGGGGAASPFDLFAQTDEQIEKLEQQIALVGETEARVAELTAKWAMLAAAKENNIDLDQVQAGTGETVRQKIEAQAKAIGDLTQEYQAARERAEFFAEQQEALKDELIDAIVEGENFADVLQDIAKAFARAALQAALFGEGPFASSFGTSDSGGLLGGLFDGLFGKRAAGGPVTAGNPYVVGEHGRELFVPQTSGRIMSASQTQRAMAAPTGVVQQKVQINVQNYNGSQVEARDRGNGRIDIAVRNAVNDVIGGGGADRAMRDRFGVRARARGA